MNGVDNYLILVYIISMKNALNVIDELTKNGLIKNYAIGGGIAAIFYIEPILTYDLDIFFIPGSSDDGLLALSPLYDYLKNKGYLPDKEHIVIEGIPVQFLPVYNELIAESVENAITADYQSIKTRVIKAEYLIAIMLQTNRTKDRERVMKFIEEFDVDKDLLEKILLKFNLKDKYNNLMRLKDEYGRI